LYALGIDMQQIQEAGIEWIKPGLKAEDLKRMGFKGKRGGILHKFVEMTPGRLK
jgi:hypothetical protein